LPEGHTIHRIAGDHQKWFAGQRLGVLSPQGRFESEAEELSGNKLLSVDAHGKHLFYHWSRQRTVHVHLGLYGKFHLHNNPPPEPRGAVRVRVLGKERSFDLNGPNCCELIDASKLSSITKRLGEDPLRTDANPGRLWQRIQKSRSAIGSVLLNQSIIAGVGNIYRSELLFLLGIHPERPANDLDEETYSRLWKLTVELLSIGVKYNRIITRFPPNGTKLSRLGSGERLNIYKKSHCLQCDSPVETWELANRKIYACLSCQT